MAVLAAEIELGTRAVSQVEIDLVKNEVKTEKTPINYQPLSITLNK